MSESVDDFFNSTSTSLPSPRPQGRLIRLPQLSDIDKHAEMIQAIQQSPFRLSTPLWEPEPNELQDPHVLYWLPEGKSYLLMNKTSKRVYVRRNDLGLYLVKRVKRDSGLENSGLEGDGEGYVLL
jgi:hypothetical protein